MLYKQMTKKPKRTRNCSKQYSELSLIRRARILAHEDEKVALQKTCSSQKIDREAMVSA